MVKGEIDVKPDLSYEKYYEYHDVYDDDEEFYERLTRDEINLKLRVFRNLCLENKINTQNAFDIDMIGYFQSWLEKQKLSSFNDVKMFQEIADYLEASAKIYGFRVDNLSENTNKLVEGFKTLHTSTFKENFEEHGVDENDVDELFQNQKSKTLRLMLTTADKLCGRFSNMACIVNPAMRQSFSNYSFKKIFENGRPINHILPLFSDTTLKDKLNKKDIKKKDNKKITTIKISFISDKFWSKAILCSEFSDFLADKDKLCTAKDSENKENIEDYIEPSNQSYTNSICDEIINDVDPEDDKLSTCSNKKNEYAIGSLLACIDNVKRDYSFFNPNLLAQWNGPKAWKTQAMAKALKSKKKAKKLTPDPNLDSDSDTDDGNLLLKHKSNKKSSKDDEEKIKIEWLSKKDLKLRLENSFKSKEKISPRTIQNWNAFNNIADTKIVSTEMKYTFTLLEYLEITPDWWGSTKKDKKEKKVTEEINSSLPTENHVDIDYSDESNTQFIETINYEIDYVAPDENDHLSDSNFDESEDDADLQDFKTETTIDIADLKKEISNIIDEECIKIESDNEWSSRILFSNLLQKLEDRQDLTLGIAYVSLLHLVNERGLKLFQDGSIINGRKDFYIARPLN